MNINSSAKYDVATREFSLCNMSLKFSLLKPGENKREEW